ncbi:MAG: phage tail assembly protein [Lamprocystis purpurea]|jgi:hypothetical protein|nr:phage tail assembly protein [Lamprocystis purpurea]
MSAAVETTIALEYAIEAHGETLSQLTLRRPRVRDLRLLDEAKGDVGKTAALIGALAGLTPREVDQLDAGDFTRLGLAVADFLPGAQPTGEP